MSDHGRSRQAAWVLRHRGDHFVFIDSGADVASQLTLRDAAVATCRFCSGVHILRRGTAWMVCSNPRCVPPPGMTASAMVSSDHLVWDDESRTAMILSAHTLGGPEAVLDIMAAHG